MTVCYIRLPLYHPQLSLIYRFDPLLPRVTRFFFLITTLCNTLFFIALLYGYSNITTTSQTKSQTPTPIESIVLSLITLVLNTPIIQGFHYLLRKVGRSEFSLRYPYLYRELQIRNLFERIWISSKDDDTLIDIRDQVLKNLGKISPFDSFKKKLDTSASFWLKLPIKSTLGVFLLVLQILWITWTFNYLFLFAVTQYSDDRTGSSEKNIFTSFGLNQIISIFIVGPINILINLVTNWIIIRYAHLLRIKRPQIPSGTHPIDFLSDPFYTKYSLGLTSELSHYLFIQGPLLASKKITQQHDYDDIIIATDKSIAMNWYVNLTGTKESAKKMDKTTKGLLQLYHLLYKKF